MSQEPSHNQEHMRDAARRHAPLLVLMLVSFLAHVSFRATTGDFGWFAAQLDSQTILEYTAHRYEVWTSRNLVELLVVTLTRHPLIWHVADIGICAAIYRSLEGLTNPERSPLLSWALCLLMLCYPLQDQFTAGWLVTSLNYTWPLAGMLYTLLCLVREARGEQLGVARTALMLLAALYAANVELLSVAILLVGAATLCLSLRRGACSWRTGAVALIGLVEMVNVFLCPGNDNRTLAETATWLPEFANFGFAEKVYLGLISTMQRYLFEWQPFFLALCVLVPVLVWRECAALESVDRARHNTRRPLAHGFLRSISLTPLLILACCQCLRHTLRRLLPHLGRLFMQVDLETGSRAKASFVLDILLLCCLLASLVWLWRTSPKGLLLSVTIAGYGLATRVVMGFSPTLFASDTRTFTYLDFSLIALVLLLIEQKDDGFSNTERGMLLGSLTMLALAMVRTTFVQLGG